LDDVKFVVVQAEFWGVSTIKGNANAGKVSEKIP
jgi:hypothetical protein